MSQLHFYVPESIAEQIDKRAKSQGISVSQFLAQLVKKELGTGRPPNFFEDTFGSWKGAPLTRGPQGSFEKREEF